MITINLAEKEAEKVLMIAKRYVLMLSEKLTITNLTNSERKRIHSELETARGILLSFSKI